MVLAATDKALLVPPSLTLLALDGNSLLHRAYHAYSASGMSDDSDKPTFAVYGFLALFAGILDKTSPDAVIVGFDDGQHNERKVKWPDYKANRSKKAEDLYTQMDKVQAILTELGVHVHLEPGWEADDVVASAAAQAAARGWKTIVATSDRDAFSLIDEHTSVLRLVSGLDNAKLLDPDALFATYNVRAEQYTDYAALRGDSSDNLPGVNGVGEKTAVKLLAAFDTVEQALADTDKLIEAIGRTFARKMVDGKDNWVRNVEIMTQRRDLDIDLDACELACIDNSKVAATLKDRGFPGLINRLGPKLDVHNTSSARSTRRAGGQPVTRDQQAPPPPPDEQGAPPPPAPAGSSNGGGRGRRPVFDAVVMRGVGRGLPGGERSVQPAELSGGTVLSTTGGGKRPEKMPVSMR